MGKKKDKEKVIVTSVGTSTSGVTGSCWTVSYPKDDNTRGLFIVEMGLPQGEHTIEKQYNTMERMAKSIVNGGYLSNTETNTSVNACFGHSHVDHIGLMPLMNSENGFRGKIYGSKESIEISKRLWKDCYKIQNSHVKYLNSKGKNKKLIYTESQMYDMFDHLVAATPDEEIVVDSNLKIKFKHNSHTIDSCNISIYCKIPSTKRWKKVLYTSDLGSKVNFDLSHYLKQQDISTEHYDLVISEATYSSDNEERKMTKKLAKQEREELRKLILSSLKEGKRVLLPTFSFSRSQQLITYFYEWFKDDEWIKNNGINFIMDSNLMLSVNEAYANILEDEEKELFTEVMSWNRLKKIDTYQGTMTFLADKRPSVALVSSGFMENGKITSYLPIYVGSSRAVIIITGYCSQDNQGSMGSKILGEQKTITFNTDSKKDRTTVIKRAEVYQFKTFSSHISHDELLNLFVELNCSKIVIHHCNEENKEDFTKECKKYLRDRNKTTQVTCVSKSTNQFVL